VQLEALDLQDLADLLHEEITSRRDMDVYQAVLVDEGKQRKTLMNAVKTHLPKSRKRKAK